MRKLQLLEALAEEPETKQVDLATRMGVAVGTVNWLLQRLAKKGYVTVKRLGRSRWSYLLTSKGFAEKARLTSVYVQQSMELYRKAREQTQHLLQEVKRAGYRQVLIEGDNDLVDVCRLTCLERGVEVINPTKGEGGEDQAPVLRVDGKQLSVGWPKERRDG